MNGSSNWIALSASGPDVLRDDSGVPVEWTLFAVGDTPFCQDGRDGALRLTSGDLDDILAYHEKKGEQIPVDSEHYLYELANRKNLDEAETARMFPQGVAALGFGALSRAGDKLRIRVKWSDAAHEMLKEKIYRYFSPVIRGLQNGPLRVTSVAMTNTPAINNLDALAAGASTCTGAVRGFARGQKTDHEPPNQRKVTAMNKLETALGRLLGRDTVALGAESGEGELDKLAGEVEQKASVLEQVKDLLKLPADATLDQIVAALTAELDKAKTAEEKQKQLDELAAAAERDEHARLVAKGRADRKIVDADMDYVNGLDSKALSAWLDHAAPKFPAPLPPSAGRLREPDAVALTAEDRAACRRLGLSEEKFLQAKRERMN